MTGGSTTAAGGWLFESRYVAMPAENIDTDQIIPARFLTTTQRGGLGRHAFQDRRRRADGTVNPDFPLDDPSSAGACVLVAGRNFGCGSSREHAVWALLDAGFRAVVSSEFADIFRGNALGNGLLPVQLPPDALAALLTGDHDPRGRLRIDLEATMLTLPDGRRVTFPVPAFARHCLLRGVDDLGFLLDAAGEIDAYEARNMAGVGTTRPPPTAPTFTRGVSTT